MFESINEIAVIATAALMLAVSTIWYSSLLFGAVWGTVAKVSADDVAYGERHALRIAVVMFFFNILAFGILSHVSVVASFIDFSIIQLSVGIVVFVWVLLGILTIAECKSRFYFLIHGGFFALYVIGGMEIINNWPW